MGRLADPRQFANIVVRNDPNGRVTRIRDVGRVELGAQDYSANAYLDERQAVALLIFQRPGSNALATADRIKATMQELAHSFPSGLRYDIVYNPTEFIAESVHEVQKTIFEAVILVVIVVILFLQTWRASIIPIVAIPVSLIGTFAVLAAFGFSLNNLSLFGLVLAIGIVVDDAIVVVENVERNLRLGMSPKEAAHRTMDEVGGALIAIALVLSAVFIPAAFIPGISGQFFRQFAITIASATIISCLCSLTLSPALCALLFKPHQEHPGRGSVLTRPITAFFRGFNYAFDKLSAGYGALTRRLLRVALLALVVYAGLIGLTGWQFVRRPTGFIPNQDQGYLITVLQLPPGASLARTDAGGATHSANPAGHAGGRARRAVRRVRWRDVHQCTQRRRDLLAAPAVPRARRQGAQRGGDPGRSAQAAGRGPGRLYHHDPAAAGARHRHRRRLQDDGAGQARPRVAGARNGDTGHRDRGQPDPRPRRRLLAVQHAHAQGLCRYRSGARGDARGPGQPRVRDVAGLSRLGLRQRLQLSRPHLPGDGAGRRAVPRRHP